MTTNPMITAKALGITSAIFWLVCALTVWIFPELSMATLQLWFHGFDPAVFNSPSISLSSFIIGGVTFTVAGWLTGYVFGKVSEKISS